MKKVLVNILAITKRCISTSASLEGKRNINKFLLPNKRGTRAFKKKQMTDPHPEIPVDLRGVRLTGYTDSKGCYVEVPEKIPQLIVPDLTDFELKPYVSYRTPNIVQSEFTTEDLFNAVYAKKIIDDWNAKELNEDGTSKKPSQEELLDAKTAWKMARKTGSDIF